MWRSSANTQPPGNRTGVSSPGIRNRRPIGLTVAGALILTAAALALAALILIRGGGAASAASTPACTPTPSPTKTPTPTPTPTPTKTPSPTCTPAPTSSSPKPTSPSPSPGKSATGGTGGTSSTGGTGGIHSTGGSSSTGGTGGTAGTHSTGGNTASHSSATRSGTVTGNSPGGANASGPGTAGGPGAPGATSARIFAHLATGAPGHQVSSTSVPHLPLGALPAVAAGNLTPRPGGASATLFPTIRTQPNPAPQAAPGDRTQAAADGGPLNRHLLGTQMLALAALCAAVGIVIARLTLRRRPPGRHAGPAADHSG